MYVPLTLEAQHTDTKSKIGASKIDPRKRAVNG
jgi:hypothetical protein